MDILFDYTQAAVEGIEDHYDGADVAQLQERLAGVVAGEKVVNDAINMLAERIAADYKRDGIDTIVGVWVPEGAKFFFQKLQPKLEEQGISIRKDTIKVSRYRGGLQGSEPYISKMPARSDWSVPHLIIEDLADENFTARCIADFYKEKGVQDIRFTFLAVKSGSAKVPIGVPTYHGIDIPKLWAVGAGMDLTVIENGERQEAYRNLPFIAVAKPKYLLRTEQIDREGAERMEELLS